MEPSSALQITTLVSIFIALLTAIANVISVVMTYSNSKEQVRLAHEAARRDARSRISASYQRFNSILLSNEKAFSASRQFLWGEIRSDERVMHNLFFTLLLHTIFEEFNIVKSGLADRQGYLNTLEMWARHIVRSNEQHDPGEFLRYLEIVEDFPEELRNDFKAAVLRHAKR